MLRHLILTSAMIGALMAGEYKVQNNSFAYYQAKKEQFWLTIDIEGVSKSVTGNISENGGIYKGTIKIDASAFKSGDRMRDSHVSEDYLHSDKHPFITYKFEAQNGNSKGTMKVNGVEKQVSFPVKIAMENNQVAIEGEVRVKYTDFNIQTPANFILKAHEDLVIGAKLFFSGTQK